MLALVSYNNGVEKLTQKHVSSFTEDQMRRFAKNSQAFFLFFSCIFEEHRTHVAQHATSMSMCRSDMRVNLIYVRKAETGFLCAYFFCTPHVRVISLRNRRSCRHSSGIFYFLLAPLSLNILCLLFPPPQPRP